MPPSPKGEGFTGDVLPGSELVVDVVNDALIIR